MDKERQLYNSFVDILIEKVESKDVTPKELEIVMNFLKNNNIQAHPSHSGLSKLTQEALNLPFNDDLDNELSIRRVK